MCRVATQLAAVSAVVQAMTGCGATDSGWPASVRTQVDSYATMCRDAGGTADTRRAVSTVDLTGDGLADYLIDVSQIACAGAASIYGDRDKPVEIRTSAKDGVRRAFMDSVYGVQLERSASGVKLWLTVAGEQCGRPPARYFADEKFCDRSLVWNGAKQEFDYAEVSTVRMIE